MRKFGGNLGNLKKSLKTHFLEMSCLEIFLKNILGLKKDEFLENGGGLCS